MTQFCTETTQIPFHSVQRPLLKSSWIWIYHGVVRNEQQLLLNRSCLAQPVPMCCVLLGTLGDKAGCPGALASAPASCGCLTSVCFIHLSWKVKVKVIQLCLTLCNPMDSIVHGILQARRLEWVAFPFPGDRPNPEIAPRSPALQADSLPTELSGKPYKYIII